MKLAVDARLMVGPHRGMGHFARALIEPVSNQVTALLPECRPTDEWPSVNHGAEFYPWWEQRILPRLAARLGATHLLCPYNTAPLAEVAGAKKIIVLHDLIFLTPIRELPLSASPYQNLGRLYRRWVCPRAMRTADAIVTVSEFSRSALCERFGIRPEQVHVLPNSISNDWFLSEPLPDQERSPYLLTVSGEAPSKNLPALLHAFARLHHDRSVNMQFVLRIAGVSVRHHHTFVRLAHHLGIVGAVRFDDYLDLPSLRRLYRNAWAFVLPSLQEGFGIPLLEAMASGTPVACSNTTSLPEVAGDAAWLFDPKDTDAITAALVSAISDSAMRKVRAKKGLERAALFHRDRIRPRIAEFWRQVA